MRRNWKQILRRALTLALCLAALAGLAVFPAAPEAEALDMNINKAGFSVPSSDTTYMYIWHEGLPPIEWNYEQLQKEGKTAPASYKEYPAAMSKA